MIEERLTGLLREALDACAGALALDGPPPEIELTRPRQKEHGDFATNVALVIAPRAGRPPREVAELIVKHLPADEVVASAEPAGPGFVNFRLRPGWLHATLREAIVRGEAFGRSEPTGLRAQVEFVSANPTGPLTLGHARNAAIGDALARLLTFTGWQVEREYYFNDAGGQMDRFGASVEARYLRLVGHEADVPQDGYHGDYVGELAREILDAEGPGLADLPSEERFVRLRAEGVSRVLGWIGATLERFGVSFDAYVSESSLAERGEIRAAVERLRAAGYAYEAGGAMWFRSTAFGDDKDRVVIRSNGAHTYFGADCAYVIDKLDRGFDHVIYVWGADHHGNVARVRGAAQALGFDPARVEMVIYQWVAFLREGVPVPMGKRSGSFISLDELIDEVGTDAARFHLLMFSNDVTMNFDIEAVKRRSMDNPVYYVQYGHARIASILRKAAERGVRLRPVEEADLSRLATDAELDLLRSLADVPGEIRRAAELRAPHRLTHAAQDLAARFHRFYTDCPVLSDDDALTQARLWLCTATKQVIALLLGLLGVSAPESMERSDA
ncbi:MAG TPA: arginine--tRNA ligase [Actinomycetota bacterium]|nr:arginine--tRNA ligase [Actinomycetota bacterium]